MITKKIVCLRCKKEFDSEIDSKGIPYKKICTKCKKSTQRFGRGVSGTA